MQFAIYSPYSSLSLSDDSNGLLPKWKTDFNLNMPHTSTYGIYHDSSYLSIVFRWCSTASDLPFCNCVCVHLFTIEIHTIRHSLSVARESLFWEILSCSLSESSLSSTIHTSHLTSWSFPHLITHFWFQLSSWRSLQWLHSWFICGISVVFAFSFLPP